MDQEDRCESNSGCGCGAPQDFEPTTSVGTAEVQVEPPAGCPQPEPGGVYLGVVIVAGERRCKYRSPQGNYYFERFRWWRHRFCLARSTLGHI